MNREDLYLKLAELHLKRVEVLQTVEWRITLSIWTFAASVVIASLANADKLKQIVAVVMPADILVIIGFFYLLLWVLYAFVFSKENYNSLVTERNRYQRMQNEAIKLVAGNSTTDFLIQSKLASEEPAFDRLYGYDCLKSGIWWFKIITTAIIMFFSWLLVAMVILPA